MLPYPLTNFEIQKYYQNKPRFNGIYSKDNLPKRNSIEIRDEAYIINLDEYYDIRAPWIALYVQNNDATCFVSFGVEYIPKEVKTFFDNKNMKTNIFRIKTYDSTMCGYFCIGFIGFLLARKTLTEFTKIFFTK